VAFSCKRRGFCPSCGARRMVETAAHLVDHVIPRVPVRQWVLSFPIALRILFAAHPQLLTPLLRIIHRLIARFLIQQAGLKGSEAHTGAVTLIQRFGSAANLNSAAFVPSPAENIIEHAADHTHAHGAPARLSWARLLKRVSISTSNTARTAAAA
jgi:hypothetical protein